MNVIIIEHHYLRENKLNNNNNIRDISNEGIFRSELF